MLIETKGYSKLDNTRLLLSNSAVPSVGGGKVCSSANNSECGFLWTFANCHAFILDLLCNTSHRIDLLSTEYNRPGLRRVEVDLLKK